MFERLPLAFEPGIFSNRSRHGSQLRYTDGKFVRWRHGVPEQIGGWTVPAITSGSVSGCVRTLLDYRPNDQVGRYMVCGSDEGAFLFTGTTFDDITPSGFAAGNCNAAISAGYGTGAYGGHTYGTPRETTTGTITDASNWSFSMWGEVVIGCFNYDGKLYDFDKEGGDTEFQLITGTLVPTGRCAIVTDERHVMVFGAGGVPGRVQWSDREDYTEWTESSTTRAGGYDLEVNTPFQCSRKARGVYIGFTLTEAYALRPQASAVVYSFERVGSDCGVAGPNAPIVVTDGSGESIYWMGSDNFFVFEGYIRKLDCDIHDYVFGDINLVQRSKFYASANREFDEVLFWYCSAGSTEIDRAVIYNYTLGVWSKAPLERTAWLDTEIFGKPLAFDASGVLYQHEDGETANGTDIDSYVISSPIAIGRGRQLTYIDEIWPDLQDGSSPIEVTIIGRDEPTGTGVENGPYSFAIGDDKIDLNLCYREFQFKWAGTNGWWELGIPEVDRRAAGLR